MSKRGAISDLNHDNWDEEEEAQEAGTFAQADKTTLQDRVIKKAKRRGITKTVTYIRLLKLYILSSETRPFSRMVQVFLLGSEDSRPQ